MRNKTNKSVINIDSVELPILTHGGKYDCHTDPLKIIKRELDSMLSHHNKIYVFRLDIRVSEYTHDNEVITRFLRTFNAWIKRKYKLKRVGYAWCREIETAKKQHYHLVFIVDGNVINTTYGKIFEKIQAITKAQGLKPYMPENAYLIKRKDLVNGDYEEYNKAFLRASYLTKDRGKDLKGVKVNSYQTSRVKPKKPKPKNDDYNGLLVA